MIYGVLSFLGAFVLFLFEPFLGKVLTPRFGGGASVWIVCMLFFQAVLLCGYAYAHVLSRSGESRRQSLWHSALLWVVLALLGWAWIRHGNPLISDVLPEPGQGIPALLWILLRTAGLPMIALAATSPLVQLWFVQAHSGRTPYRLYAWSNAGSLGGLLAYPFAAEPMLSTPAQGILIFLLIGVFALGIWTLHRAAVRNGDSPSGPEAPPTVDAEPETGVPAASASPLTPWLWVLASAMGSAILMASTNKMTMEIAAIPLLWILPLVLYLGTFILVFDAKWKLSWGWWPAVWLLLFAAAAYLAIVARSDTKHQVLMPLLEGSIITFAGCMVCHGFLFESRPAPSGLTRFYLLIAAGGVLGGLLVALAAPFAFNRIYEFGIAMLGVAIVGLLTARELGGAKGNLIAISALAAMVAGGFSLKAEGKSRGHYLRNFYGIIRVLRIENLLELSNLKTLHGLVDLKAPGNPLVYYTPDSGIGRVLRMEMARKQGLRVGAVGLGVGSVADYGREGDEYVFYEINPLVINLAGPDSQVFPLLRNSKAKIEVVEGDGRICLEQELREGRARGYDVLLIDAFSGDSVPWHLLTVEAFQTYLRHLAPDGVLVLHVSNPLPVDRIALSSAKALDLYGAYLVDLGPSAGKVNPLHSVSDYIVLTRDAALLKTPIILERLLAGFGPKIYRGQSEGSARVAFLSADRPWRDDRNSLSQLLFKRTALEEIGRWNLAQAPNPSASPKSPAPPAHGLSR
ncbi:MAG: fused MFS/spermidine synthase [Holophagaceae bacterium]|nr:fused MFS/spermidine synthase [Holophagaceae bacterium]